MTKQTKLWLICTAILVIVSGTFLIAADIKADDKDSKEIANLSYQINELRKSKEKCFDDLTWQETMEYLSGYTKPCVQWDEEIMALRERADQLKAKSYEVGLVQSR